MLPIVSVTLPVPSTNGSGAAVDVSALDVLKTVIIEGSLQATVLLEISNDAGVTWAPWKTIQAKGTDFTLTAPVVAEFMRATTKGYMVGSAVCTVGSQTSQNTFVNVPVPTANGGGTPVAVDQYGSTWSAIFTFQGNFGGNLALEISQDGPTWSQVGRSLAASDYINLDVAAAWVRVFRRGYDSIIPGPAVVNLGTRPCCGDEADDQGGTLDAAYNYGGPAAGREIEVISEEPVLFTLGELGTDVDQTTQALLLDNPVSGSTQWSPTLAFGGFDDTNNHHPFQVSLQGQSYAPSGPNIGDGPFISISAEENGGAWVTDQIWLGAAGWGLFTSNVQIDGNLQLGGNLTVVNVVASGFITAQAYITSAQFITAQAYMGFGTFLTMGAGSASAVSGAGSGRLIFNELTNIPQISANGGAYSNIALVANANQWAAQQYSAPVALTYGANVAVNALLSNWFTLGLAGATAQLDNPTNLAAGMTFIVVVTQTVGAQALTFGTNYSFGAEGAPNLTTSAIGVFDIITFVATSATKLAGTTLRGFS
jgi:hypothetical protein